MVLPQKLHECRAGDDHCDEKTKKPQYDYCVSKKDFFCIAQCKCRWRILIRNLRTEALSEKPEPDSCKDNADKSPGESVPFLRDRAEIWLVRPKKSDGFFKK